MEKYKTGLIMEGGAMRGLFTCGIIDVFLENGIEFDGAAGISAGAVFGCNYKSRQIGRSLRYNKKYCKDPRYCSFRSLIKTGDLYGAEFCYRTLPDKLDPFDKETFRNNPMDFYVGATDTETGKALFYNCLVGDHRDMDWMRASASMPIVSRPVEIDGYRLLDGGISCPVPFEFMEEQDYNRNVIILTQPAGYVKPKTRFVRMMRYALRKYPKVADVMENRSDHYNWQLEQISKREKAGSVLVIRPPEALGIGKTEKDPSELDRVYQIGRREALRRLDEIRSFIS